MTSDTKTSSLAGTGYIDFEEFRTLVVKKMQEDEDERELKEIFRVLDKEKKGEVNVNELRYNFNFVGISCYMVLWGFCVFLNEPPGSATKYLELAVMVPISLQVLFFSVRKNCLSVYG